MFFVAVCCIDVSQPTVCVITDACEGEGEEEEGREVGGWGTVPKRGRVDQLYRGHNALAYART